MATLKAQMDEILAARVARRKVVAEVMTPETQAQVDTQVSTHAAQHFANLLDDGVDDDAAMAGALDEAKRMEKHLVRTRLMHADGSIPRTTRSCPVCTKATTHVLELDAHGDQIATCLCGAWTKIPPDAQ